jgi:hypothetical protein
MGSLRLAPNSLIAYSLQPDLMIQETGDRSQNIAIGEQAPVRMWRIQT